MLNIKRIDRIPNEEIYQLVNQKQLSITIAKRQLEWVGHILRRDISEPIRKLAFYNTKHGKSKQGRPCQTYHQNIARLINKDYQMS